MNLQYHFKNGISDEVKEELKQYADKRFENLEKYCSTFQDDNKLLHIDVEHQTHHNQYEVKTTLSLGGKQLHHVEVSHSWMEAIDKSEANLTHQAKKYVDQLRENGNHDLPDLSDEDEEMDFDSL